MDGTDKARYVRSSRALNELWTSDMTNDADALHHACEYWETSFPLTRAERESIPSISARHFGIDCERLESTPYRFRGRIG